jgi:hypothetical protein
MPALSRHPAGVLGGLGQLFNWFVRGRDYYFSQPRLKFEGMTLGLAVVVGLLVMPALIYVAGRFALKPYQNGSLFALYGDFFAGLVELKPSYWVVLLGPFVFLSLFRGFRFALSRFSPSR